MQHRQKPGEKLVSISDIVKEHWAIFFLDMTRLASTRW